MSDHALDYAPKIDPVAPFARCERGDVLLYAPRGLYGFIIATKTWSNYGHCEVFDGATSLASRDHIGVGRYPRRASGLRTILRCRKPLDMAAALRWFASVDGQAYDWLGLLSFTAARLQGFDNEAQFCSEFVARFIRRGIAGSHGVYPDQLEAMGLDPFNGRDADAISPDAFRDSALFRVIAHAVEPLP